MVWLCYDPNIEKGRQHSIRILPEVSGELLLLLPGHQKIGHARVFLMVLSPCDPQFPQHFRSADPDDYFLVGKAPDERINGITVFDLSDRSNGSCPNFHVRVIQAGNQSVNRRGIPQPS